MRVLVTGANGFIGRHVTAHLLTQGHDVVAASRQPEETARRFPRARSLRCDFRRDLLPEAWAERLNGVDAVVNCVGILEGRDSERVHVTGAAALFVACANAGIRRVIHLSAISADLAANTDYALTKHRGEEALRATDLDWVVLRPSLVYGEGSYGGSSLLRGLAALPFAIPVPDAGTQAFAPIHVDDLAETVVRLLARPALARVTLAPVGPETVRLRDLLMRLRAWLDLPPARIVAVPMPLIRAAGVIGAAIGLKTLRPTAIRQIEHGNVAPVEPFEAAIGIRPRTMAEAMTARPSHVQDRWHARLYFVRSALRLILGFTWLLSGLLGLPAAPAAGIQFGPALGLAPDAATVLFVAFCSIDLAIGGLILARWRPAAVAAAQFALVLGYSLAVAWIAPGLWLDPFGPMVKNAAVLGCVLALAAMDSDR